MCFEREYAAWKVFLPHYTATRSIFVVPSHICRVWYRRDVQPEALPQTTAFSGLSIYSKYVSFSTELDVKKIRLQKVIPDTSLPIQPVHASFFQWEIVVFVQQRKPSWSVNIKDGDFLNSVIKCQKLNIYIQAIAQWAKFARSSLSSKLFHSLIPLFSLGVRDSGFA